MPVKTGYKIAELTVQAERIKTQAAALVAELPSKPLQVLELVCSCDRCIELDVYMQLIRTPPPQFTVDQIGQYFGGAGAVPIDIGEEEQREARIIFTHVLAHLGHSILRTREQERTYDPAIYFVEPAYWIESLMKTGFIDTLPHEVKAQMRVYLLEVVAHAAAKDSARFRDALIYLTMATDALPQLLEDVRTGPPRKHLRFWTSVASGLVNRGPGGKNPRGIDLYSWFATMPERAVDTLMLALDHPETERMMERYAMAAKDEGWLTYLSRLLQWREATLQQSFFSTRKLR